MTPMTPGGILVYCFGVFIISVMINEIGHVFALRILGFDKKIHYEDSEDSFGFYVPIPNELLPIERSAVYSMGLLLGVLVYLVAAVWFWPVLFLLPFYFWGAWDDIQLAIKYAR